MLVYYTYEAKQLNKDCNQAFAKKLLDEDTNLPLYFIKLGECGNYANRPLNPYDVDYWRQTNYVYFKVKETVFNFYIKFLETRNILYLLHVERNLL